MRLLSGFKIVLGKPIQHGRSVAMLLICMACLELNAESATFHLKPTDYVVWKSRDENLSLIINLHSKLNELEALPAAQKATTIINTVLDLGVKTFQSPPYVSESEIKAYVIDVEDMDEYGAGKGEWREIATLTLQKKDSATVITADDFKIPVERLSNEVLSRPFANETPEDISTRQNEIRFHMPEKIYLVAGVEQSFFYENLVTLKDVNEVVFTPGGSALSLAKQQRRNLLFNPTETSVGSSLQLDMKVTDWDGKTLASGSSRVIVSPPIVSSKAPRGEPLRILIIGHSLPSMYWPAYLANYLSGEGNPDYVFVGGIKYWYGLYPDMENKPPVDKLWHEASPGYNVNNLLHYYTEKPPANPNMPATSPFVYKDKNGKTKLDTIRYRNEKLEGLPPHIILLNIGDNDTFHYDPDKRDKQQEALFVTNMNLFIDHLIKMAPKSIIGAMMPNTYNYTEKSFLMNYGKTSPRWKQLRNRQTYIELMYKIAKQRNDLEVIPSNFVVDGIDGMPYNSGTHFNNIGARQFAGAAYAWIRSKLASVELNK